MVNESVTHSKFSTGDTESDKHFYPKTENVSIFIRKLNEKYDFHVHKGKVNSIKGFHFLKWEEIQKNHAQSEVAVKVNQLRKLYIWLFDHNICLY